MKGQPSFWRPTTRNSWAWDQLTLLVVQDTTSPYQLFGPSGLTLQGNCSLSEKWQQSPMVDALSCLHGALRKNSCRTQGAVMTGICITGLMQVRGLWLCFSKTASAHQGHSSDLSNLSMKGTGGWTRAAAAESQERERGWAWDWYSWW